MSDDPGAEPREAPDVPTADPDPPPTGDYPLPERAGVDDQRPPEDADA